MAVFAIPLGDGAERINSANPPIITASVWDADDDSLAAPFIPADAVVPVFEILGDPDSSPTGETIGEFTLLWDSADAETLVGAVQSPPEGLVEAVSGIDYSSSFAVLTAQHLCGLTDFWVDPTPGVLRGVAFRPPIDWAVSNEVVVAHEVPLGGEGSWGDYSYDAANPPEVWVGQVD